MVGQQAADDVVQDALVKIWAGRAGFDPRRAGFATWSGVIARNTAVDQYRSNLRGRELDATLRAGSTEYGASVCEDAALAAEVMREVRDAAGHLTSEQRRALFQAF